MNNNNVSHSSQSFLPQADILIIDDVLENIQLLSAILDSSGYQTRKATSGKMAMTAIAATLPDLILLDIRMPEMTGYEVCQRLKTDPKTAHIPVIFLSAADNVSDKVEAFRVGGADYITKPFHGEEVLARVQHQLNIIAAQHTIRQLNSQLEQRVKERTQQLEAANAQLVNMAFRDLLTQLPNRALLMKQLQTILQSQSQNVDQTWTILYLDCDRFKNVNDSLGHQAGDELLIAIAQRLQSILRPEDLLFRLGGDEFVILLNHLTKSDLVVQTAEQILNRFSIPFYLRERDIFVSFSMGIVLDCSTYQNFEELLRDADTALYQAKDLGKNQYQIFVPAMYQEICKRLQLEADLRKAILNEEFVLYYQPIVELATTTIVGVEALIRWNHPQVGLIPPDQFIPIAEETGLILKLGHWVLETACRQLCSWQKQLVDLSFSVSINVSAHQFSQATYLQQVDEVLTKTQINPSCLKLEITETAIMQNNTLVAGLLQSLHERSIQLSIDDFGTGYSSLNYLHSFPLDYLKIDRSFVQRLHQEKSSLGLVTAIVQIAKTMGMTLVAEGIETVEQMNQLKVLGCHMGQGYLFSRPLPAEEITNLLATSLSHK